uniref:Nuclear transcription factor Y subunit n=1 Tax=Panagrolaimus sp. ES5 TaxID=591445 RepID=A0AC34FBE0_9BILA
MSLTVTSKSNHHQQQQQQQQQQCLLQLSNGTTSIPAGFQLISNQNCPVMLPMSADGTTFVPFTLSSVLQQKGGGQGTFANCKIDLDSLSAASTSSSSIVTPTIITTPPEDDEKPLYVNAKQYQRILKRRIARAKLVESGRFPKERRKYLHESRHQHALKRARGEGGKFDSKTDNTNSPNSKRQRSTSTISNTSSTDLNKSKDNNNHK